MIPDPPPYREIIETADFGIGVIDASGRYIFTNPKWAEMTGYSQSELLSLSVFDITVPEDIGPSRDSIRTLFSEAGSMYSLEKRFRRKDGSIFWGRVAATPILDDKGEVQSVNGLIADITHLKESLVRIRDFSALHQAHARINALLLDIPRFSDFIPGFTAALVQDTSLYRADVYRLDANRQILHSLTGNGEVVDPSLQGSFKQALRSGHPVFGTRPDPTSREEGHIGIYPVTKGTNPWGLLVLYSRTDRLFDPDLEPLVRGFAKTLSHTLDAHSLATLHRRTEQQLGQVRNTYRSLLQISAAGGETSNDREFISKVVRILGHNQGMALVTAFLLSSDRFTIEPILLLAAGVSEREFRMEDPPVFPAPFGDHSFESFLPSALRALGWEEWAREVDRSGSLVSRYISLYREGRVCGYLSVSSFDRKFFEKDTLSLIEETRRIVSFVLDSRSREREQKHLERQQKRISMLHEALNNLNQVVSKKLREPDFLTEASRILFKVGPIKEVGFYLPSHDHRHLHLAYFSGQTKSQEPFSYPFSFSTGPQDPDSSTLTIRAFRTGKPVYSNNLNHFYRSQGLDSLATQYRKLSWESAGTIPISRGKALYGILAIVSGEKDFFDKETILLVEEFARTISYALNASDLEESRLVSERKLRKLAALYEALHRINRLIGIRPDPDRLYDETCRVLVSHGGLLDATVLLYDAERQGLALKVLHGPSEHEESESLARIFFSTEPGHPDGLTGIVTAFHSGTPVVNQDFSENFAKPEFERLSRWGDQFGWKSGASFPIFSNVTAKDPESAVSSGHSVIGLLTVTSGEVGFFQDSLVSLLEEAARSISFALQTWKEDLARKESEEKLRKTSELYAALNGVNRLVNLRPDEQTLFDETCRIVTDIGMLYLSRILTVDPENEGLRPVAVYGRDNAMTSFFRELSFPPSAESGENFRELSPQACIMKKRPSIHHNLVKELDSMGLGSLSAKAVEFRLWSQGSFPISRNGKISYVLSIFAEKIGFFDDDLVSLLDEISQTLSYALDNIDRDRQRQSAEDHLRSSEEKYRLLMEEAGDGILILDELTNRVVDANKSATRLFGMRKTDLVGEGRSKLLPEISRYHSPNGEPSSFPRDLGDSHVFRPTRYHLHGNPDFLREVEVIESRLIWKDTPLIQLRLRDVTELHFYETELRKLAQHDSLTGLLNRHSFQLQMDDLLRTASFESHFALFYIDLDNFKSINDTFGHDVGDLLLIDVAAKVRRSVREGDLVARIGGDEFLVLVTDAISSNRVSGIARTIISSLDTPSVCNGHSITIHASIGISCYPDNGTDPKNLIKIADLAMYRSKREGRNRFTFHEQDSPSH
jgi:diguanylate cyclase (GGDEF)-like protein/PAS domain S-box-containing protein